MAASVRGGHRCATPAKKHGTHSNRPAESRFSSNHLNANNNVNDLRHYDIRAQRTVTFAIKSFIDGSSSGIWTDIFLNVFGP